LIDGSVMTAEVEVSALSSYKSLNGIIVLTNKSFANGEIAHMLSGRIGNSSIVIMQNGLGIEKPFQGSGFASVNRCVLFSTSQSISDSIIQFKPVSPSPIGHVAGTRNDLEDIVASLNTSWFQFTAVDNILPIVWTKVIANCVFNSICPLLEIDNGIFHRSVAARTLAETVITECVSVANDVGIPVNASEVLATVLRISKSSEGQLISTLQDIRNGRPTEIESLNFAVAQIAMHSANERGTPVTKILGELTKLKSEIHLR
jgi:2-dehydropantoate 2-reductase